MKNDLYVDYNTNNKKENNLKEKVDAVLAAFTLAGLIGTFLLLSVVI